MRQWLCICLWMTLVWGVGGIAQANDVKEAREYYRRGAKLYATKHYKQALGFFKRAIQALPKRKFFARTRNELRYFLGMCYYRLRQLRKAQRILTTYMKEGANPRREAQVKRVLLRLRDRLGPLIERRTPPIVPRPKPRVLAPVRRGPHPSSYILLGVGAAGVLTGGLFGILTQVAVGQRDAIYQAGPQQHQASEVQEPTAQAKTYATSSNALYVAGGAVFVAGGLVMWLTWQRAPAPTRSHRQPPGLSPIALLRRQM